MGWYRWLLKCFWNPGFYRSFYLLVWPDQKRSICLAHLESWSMRNWTTTERSHAAAISAHLLVFRAWPFQSDSKVEFSKSSLKRCFSSFRPINRILMLERLRSFLARTLGHYGCSHWVLIVLAQIDWYRNQMSFYLWVFIQKPILEQIRQMNMCMFCWYSYFSHTHKLHNRPFSQVISLYEKDRFCAFEICLAFLAQRSFGAVIKMEMGFYNK